MEKSKKTNYLRLSFLGVILMAVMYEHYNHITFGTQYPSVHAICPFGGMENLWAVIAGRVNISKIYSGTMILFWFTMIFALLFNRSFCGYICPFGALQEFFSKLKPKKLVIPSIIDKPLRYLKYVLLVLVTFMAWNTMTLWMSPYDPWAAFSHIYSGMEVVEEFFIGLIILIISLLGSIFVDRFFCKYLCPAGALYGIVGKISPFKVHRKSKCLDCNKCSQVCPVNIDVAKETKVNSMECISCGLCITVCPDSSKYIGFKSFKKTLNPLAVLLVVVTVFFGSLMILDALEYYVVSIPSIDEIEIQQQYLDIADLRGSMTIELGAQYSGKNIDEFYEIMEIPKSIDKTIRLKEVGYFVEGYDFHVMKAKHSGE